MKKQQRNYIRRSSTLEKYRSRFILLMFKSMHHFISTLPLKVIAIYQKAEHVVFPALLAIVTTTKPVRKQTCLRKVDCNDYTPEIQHA